MVFFLSVTQKGCWLSFPWLCGSTEGGGGSHVKLIIHLCGLSVLSALKTQPASFVCNLSLQSQTWSFFPGVWLVCEVCCEGFYCVSNNNTNIWWCFLDSSGVWSSLSLWSDFWHFRFCLLGCQKIKKRKEMTLTFLLHLFLCVFFSQEMFPGTAGGKTTEGRGIKSPTHRGGGALPGTLTFNVLSEELFLHQR